MATIKKVKKAMMGTKEGPGPKKTVMQKLKIKYPDADTSRTGDVRGTEMNAYADKKTLQRYNDTYNAFEKKFGNKPAKDKKGGVVKKKNGGSLSGLKASNKRVGPIDPKGAWTKVQEKTLAGAKGKASLTRDKELGATKMKMGGKAKKK